jgi:hypothetical protein
MVASRCKDAVKALLLLREVETTRAKRRQRAGTANLKQLQGELLPKRAVLPA